MKIAIIGTGYVGLVSGACLAEVGHDIICVDIDDHKIARLNKCEIPIYEPGLADLVHKNYVSNRLHFTTRLSEIGEPQAVFFALPTPTGGDGQADLSFVMSAAEEIAGLLKGYTVLINKSTVPVGTADKVREVMAAKTKIDFDVVSNPEFLREGFAVNDFLQADRIIVGTSSARARKVMEEVYHYFTEEGVPLLFMDEESSEMTKYAANSFLATKISFMNEIANLCERVGANVDCVREGIGMDQRIGNRSLFAGIGYGGSCFPKDVLALHKTASLTDYDFKILSAVMAVNERQKKILVEKIVQQMGDNLESKTFAVWGLAFKPDTDDIREAPSLEIIRELLGRGATVRAYDPEAMENMARLLPDVDYADSAIAAIKGADALLIVTEWKEFFGIEPELIADALKEKLVFDGRNVFEPKAMQRAGLKYYSIGR